MTTPTSPGSPSYPLSLMLFSAFYGGMVTIAGVLGAKQVAVGPLAVEAGIFPFLILVGISSGIAELHGEQCAARLARFGLVPLVAAILLTLFVLRLPTDPGMYEPAKEAFPVILGQSWRMMVAGIVAYAVSLTLNIWIFSRLQRADGRFVGLRGFVAAALSQIVDTVVFITISFYGVRPIAAIMAGQMTAKVVLSAVLVPAVIWLVVKAGRRMDAG
ncbi:MAG: queuosine precursor transporter [Novosphingobium sp.]|nr:queuosine precursor transporter [Novosphingobium sp.]MCP5401799.1 queuosine precursor transporter [Novosphingobium sp.]